MAIHNEFPFRRLCYAGAYRMEDATFLPMFRLVCPKGLLYVNPNDFFISPMMESQAEAE